MVFTVVLNNISAETYFYIDVFVYTQDFSAIIGFRI